jgi:hypothetical protein
VCECVSVSVWVDGCMYVCVVLCCVTLTSVVQKHGLCGGGGMLLQLGLFPNEMNATSTLLSAVEFPALLVGVSLDPIRAEA